MIERILTLEHLLIVYFVFSYRVAAMDSINNAITNGQTNGVVVSGGTVGSATVGVVTAGSVVGQGKHSN